MRKFSDQELLTGVYSRNDIVIQHIMETMKPGLTKYVLRSGGSFEDVGYVMVEAVVAIFSKAEQPVLISSFKTYFFSVAKRLWLYELRRRKSFPNFVSMDEVRGLSNDCGNDLFEQRRQMVQYYLAKLPEFCQRILKMVSLGYGNEEIKDELGLSSVQYAKNRKSHCNAKLIEMLKQDSQYTDLLYDKD